MRLATYTHARYSAAARVGVIQGDRVIDVAGLVPDVGATDLLTLLDQGPDALAVLAAAAERFAAEHRDTLHVPPEIAVPAWEATLQAPLPRPRTLRGFYPPRQPVAGHANASIPAFAYGHPATIFGPGAAVPRPRGVKELDFEMDVACVIGRAGRDVPAASALDHIAGFTVMNDWTARDVEREELGLGVGPAKAKDFATSLGPHLVTLEDVSARLVDGRLDAVMVARVNDEEVVRSNARDLAWTFGEMVERASWGVDLMPGDVVACGLVRGGSLLRAGAEAAFSWLEPGDEVELEVEGLGRLRNRIEAAG